MKELAWIARVRARRVPLTSILLFIVAAVVLGHTTGASPGWQEAGRYWQQAKYQAERSAYEAKRDDEYQEERVLDIAGVHPGMTVGEVGAGNGYFTLKLARRIGPPGKVYANDIIADALAELRDRAREQGLPNIETILGTELDPRLPAGSLDIVFLVRVLHDLSRPVDVLEKIAASLKPGAKVIVVEVEGGKAWDGKNVVFHTRKRFLDIIGRSRFKVERIDDSLPNARSVVLILTLSGKRPDQRS